MYAIRSYYGYFGLQAFSHAKKYEAGALKLVMDQNIHNQAEYQLKSIAEDLSLGYFQNEKRIEREKIVRENTLHQEVSVRYTRYAVGMAGIVLLVGYFFGGLRSLVLFGGMAAAMLLLFGIFTPLLTVTVHVITSYSIHYTKLYDDSFGRLSCISKCALIIAKVCSI